MVEERQSRLPVGTIPGLIARGDSEDSFLITHTISPPSKSSLTSLATLFHLQPCLPKQMHPSAVSWLWLADHQHVDDGKIELMVN